MSSHCAQHTVVVGPPGPTSPDGSPPWRKQLPAVVKTSTRDEAAALLVWQVPVLYTSERMDPVQLVVAYICDWALQMPVPPSHVH